MAVESLGNSLSRLFTDLLVSFFFIRGNAIIDHLQALRDRFFDLYLGSKSNYLIMICPFYPPK